MAVAKEVDQKGALKKFMEDIADALETKVRTSDPSELGKLKSPLQVLQNTEVALKNVGKLSESMFYGRKAGGKTILRADIPGEATTYGLVGTYDTGTKKLEHYKIKKGDKIVYEE